MSANQRPSVCIIHDSENTINVTLLCKHFIVIYGFSPYPITPPLFLYLHPVYLHFRILSYELNGQVIKNFHLGSITFLLK